MRDQTQEKGSRRPLLVRAILCLVVLCGLLAPGQLFALELNAPPDEGLLELRAARRTVLRAQSAGIEKEGQPALFGLLVVPVEFADTPFPSGWDPKSEISPVLNGESSATMANYFQVASDRKLEMRITLTPIVSLTRARSQYSDLGSTNSLRSRMMATETLEILRDWGLEFRRLDMDGPDGIPASGDDDGQVDGVLFLHAGIGLENDMDTGLIPAHQYYLTEPVVSDGIGASFYAVASHASGLGIWAHETGHLLGMEDRYDPRLKPTGGSEIQSRGGLGRFSLMASGAWGTGQGRQPALPDAYTCLQLGWVKIRELDGFGREAQTIRPGLVSGEVGRIWTNGQSGTEFFLVETRNPTETAPFDAAVPGEQLLIYHVDESLPEGYLIQDSYGSFHLRVQLVEADGNDSLATGLDDGGLADLFPGSEGNSSFGSLTNPNSFGYEGSSGVELSQISTMVGGVSLLSRSTLSYAAAIEMSWNPANPAALELSVRELGEPLSQLDAHIQVDGPQAWGHFLAGGLIREISLVEVGPGQWAPAEPVFWVRDPEVPAGAITSFTIQIIDPVWTSEIMERPWVWSPGGQTLEFGSLWPGEWIAARPGISPKTGWFRWDAEPWLTVNQVPVLACVDTIFPDSSEWPDVRYNNYGYATLTSGPLDPSLRGVRLVHAVEGDLLTGAVALDGGQVVWVAPDGSEHPAEPIDGWEALVHGQAYSPQGGQGVLIGTTPFLRDDLPVWHTDIFPVPPVAFDPGQAVGPWRLRLVFASDAAGYGHGWFIASIQPLFGPLPASAFPVQWGSKLAWSWPGSEVGVLDFRVEEFQPEADDWILVAESHQLPDPLSGEFSLSGLDILSALREKGRNRTRIRIVGEDGAGLLASRPLVIYPDGGPGQPVLLGEPWPNPSADGSVRFLAEIPLGQAGNLTIHDLRGRLIQSWSLPSGNHFLLWRGLDTDGRRVASGTYFMRLEGSGAWVLRKVVLLH